MLHQQPLSTSSIASIAGLSSLGAAAAGNKQHTSAPSESGYNTPPVIVVQTLRSLASLDVQAQGHLRLARQHAANAARIEALRDGLRLREERTKAAIGELARIKGELDWIVKNSEMKTRAVNKAEKHPLSFEDVLSYASRLSSITSAPPGFKLPTQMALSTENEAEADTKAHQGVEGKETKPNVAKEGTGSEKRPPMAFYDPKMPGMPEKLPFPDEGMMRRGTLGALAVGQGVTFAPVPAATALGPQAGEGSEEGAATALAGLPTEEMLEEAKRRAEEARAMQEAEEADAFDLDLN
ncbi:hypothetical protein K437DRAFT_224712 [Tilletiaria anomala UBC 951]|uniref:Mediator of RNA polymerase II transcription subunit 4 n=1 Tax=Tilletiaria anomala (strain ATCC 24038 / CBS 436.72 / UBC 951) TaxID=1037660 RepID=A0A066VTC4_TILAU|nr:uncharacterized protein K437DRAFT_224712 [Tilletiaria anomala UBC 951]KDN44726.1 hypothetical protein K437DRAFT_224712 [Tilletiaria anomala UBC 951]